MSKTRWEETMTVALQLSDDPRDKLQAVLSHNWPGPDSDDLGAGYRHACAEWFASLSGHDKTMAAWVVEVYDDGKRTAQAARVATSLPAAPRCPL
jgi:hypothetical protein